MGKLLSEEEYEKKVKQLIFPESAKSYEEYVERYNRIKDLVKKHSPNIKDMDE